MTINVGDRVTWQTRTTAWPYLHTNTGVVTQIRDKAEDWPGYAFVRADGREFSVPLLQLTQVGAIEAVTDDYAYALRHCGDLGGVEFS